MILHFGTRISRSRRGYVADFCPFCNDVRPHRLIRVGEYRHFNFIPTSGTRTIGFERYCDECRVPIACNAADYPQPERSSGLDLEVLIAKTNPHVRQNWATRIADFRAIVRRERIPGERRDDYIREMLLLLNDPVHERSRGAHIDMVSVLSIVGTAVCIVLAGFAVNKFGADRLSLDARTYLVMGALAAIFVIPLLFIATDPWRFKARKVYPPLAKGMARLNPTVEELSDHLNKLRGLGYIIGRKLNPRSLHRRIERERERTSIN